MRLYGTLEGSMWVGKSYVNTHIHTRLTAPFLGLPTWAGTRKVKPIWILLKQETVSGSGISWDICKSATRSRQITAPAPHHSVFYRPDALPVTQPTASKHLRQGNNTGNRETIPYQTGCIAPGKIWFSALQKNVELCMYLCSSLALYTSSYVCVSVGHRGSSWELRKLSVAGDQLQAMLQL